MIEPFCLLTAGSWKDHPTGGGFISDPDIPYSNYWDHVGSPALTTAYHQLQEPVYWYFCGGAWRSGGIALGTNSVGQGLFLNSPWPAGSGGEFCSQSDTYHFTTEESGPRVYGCAGWVGNETKSGIFQCDAAQDAAMFKGDPVNGSLHYSYHWYATDVTHPFHGYYTGGIYAVVNPGYPGLFGVDVDYRYAEIWSSRALITIQIILH